MKEASWATRPLDDELGEALRAELLSWPNMQARAMMGTLGFFLNRRMLGCYVNRTLSKRKPRWMNRIGEPTYACIRLERSDALRALRLPGIHLPRLKFRGWVEV